MFGNIGWGETMILLVAALVVLGPERLPGAIGWVSTSLRQVREYASGASTQLKDALGSEFEDLRKPLADLQQLRGMTPKAVITTHLLDGDDSIFTGNFNPPATTTPLKNDPATSTLPQSTPPAAGERPTIDTDAT
ncbi:Sec-independent protein translocase protein TatB (plasmid) [Rhodococcus qingshengii]|uniref:Sec-independent protein translocase protein TatB n=1 Tax=Rhodococcus qingshengii TaxID=334542 RepID=UPI0007E55B5D|nr:Sec-independent protein translocase protein TatB [Rhodococcus qingshengii]BCF86291.1 Sec-independent protein translocase protein TatB [Rhodococcus qingshengii]